MKLKFLIKSWHYVALISLGVCFSYSDSYAQDVDETTARGGLAIGAKIGVNLNQFSQPGTNIGTNVGGFARYQILDFLDVQGELVYSLEGGGRQEFYRDMYIGGYDGPISDIYYINRSIYLHNIEIPVSARLTLPELNTGSIVPKFIVGGSYSFNLAAFESNDKVIYFNDGTSGLVSNTRENVRGDYFPHNFSAHVGMALDFALTNGNVFTMEIRYRQGFNNLNQVSTIISEITDKLHSATLSINFSYRIF
ncbi:MAG: PorT family protein [Cyclobacteriaceae bacterium]|nr:PorT family protein [Cyclobacteriaceae bacterium]